MAFQTSVLQEGEWVTRTVRMDELLKPNPSPQAQEPAGARRPVNPPLCGLLTRTVVESNLVNQILTVTLRSVLHNDVAFVGDYFVRIKELQSDGRFKHVIKKNDFDSRIRRACVVGTWLEPPAKEDQIKSEVDDPPHISSSQPDLVNAFPPQMLALVLENGDTVFLFVRTGADGQPEFVMSRFPSITRLDLISQPGYHMVIDPSSRYMALACPENCFVVYELESIDQLRQRYNGGEPPNIVKFTRARAVRGVILQMQFLHPRHGNDHHIILLLIVVRNGKSRAVIYEWELGDDLMKVFAEEKNGYRMPIENQMPLILIPLRVQSAFMTISPKQMAICTQIRHGPPHFATQELPSAPPTANHRGDHPPLWTAWARPFRLPHYLEQYDCLYLAREDGAVAYLEVDEDMVPRVLPMDGFDMSDCNISTAFACLYDQFTDVLILGSDTGPGALWKAPARDALKKIGTLPNWSMCVDLTTTYQPPQRADEDINTASSRPGRYHIPPDRIFTTSGQAAKGSIVEVRYGLKANIALDVDFGPGIKRAWLFAAETEPVENYQLLLSMPDSTTLLSLKCDFEAGETIDDDSTAYDLTSQTLAFSYKGGVAVQITERGAVLVSGSQSLRVTWQGFPGLLGACISDACVLGECIALSAYVGAQFQLHIFKIDEQLANIAHFQVIEVDGEVTCLSIRPDFMLLVGVWRGGRPLFGHGSLRNGCSNLDMMDLTQKLAGSDKGNNREECPLLEAISSIVSVGDALFIGTRSGEVVRIDANKLSTIEYEKFGLTEAKVACCAAPGASTHQVLVTCDNSLILLDPARSDSEIRRGCLGTKRRVWPVDSSDLSAPTPPVHFAAPADITLGQDLMPIIMVSGSRFVMAEVEREPGPVHRFLPVGGTPTQVMYSEVNRCLVAAVSRGDKPTLVFLDPETGQDLGRPTDKNGGPLEHISGLGKAGDRIYGLEEWEYRKDGSVWHFILVSTKSGSVIVVSTQRLEGRDGLPASIRYWARFRGRELEKPIYSILGYEKGLVYCVGQTLYWDMLDTTLKRLRHLKSFQLESPATALSLSNGKLLALTAQDSIEVIDFDRENPSDAKLAHIDPKRRNAIHMIEVTGPEPEERQGDILLVSDRECGVTGLWTPWQTPERDCLVVFEAELGTTIRRFVRGRTRPIWEQRQRAPKYKYGRLMSTADGDADILGISMDGTMYHFTLLRLEIWRFLRFIQNLALFNNESGSTPEPIPDRKLDMQVDGNLLQRFLDHRMLEKLVWRPEHISRFMELLRELDNGSYTVGMAEGDQQRYFELAYDILEYYLRPVL